MTHRTLFSVIEVTPEKGDPYCYVDWHHDLGASLERLNPDGKITDRLIDIAEELLDVDEGDDEDDAN